VQVAVDEAAALGVVLDARPACRPVTADQVTDDDVDGDGRDDDDG
jgi:hypothetical protein